MRVTKAQAEANRARIVETASTLFRERGYDGVGVVDLMAAAGFTHGGFYKHFRSKADLMDEAAACGLAQTMTKSRGLDLTQFIKLYISREHRDQRGDGCTIAALCGDAARQSEDIKATFAGGMETMLAAILRNDNAVAEEDRSEKRARAICLMASTIGAVMLSRACPDDSSLADEILTACRTELLATLSPTTGAKE
ncbi:MULTISPECIES: TetR/AcrR family transcriptional regulator [Pseudomonas]|uniref:TetR/AcrR family transcriptional regulator n=1 Tax=Pseudomonas aphyarum TaxID=2942629 RepID=A0ABT5PR15_9PSED|nr:TetR family transcriptional regulator [Pseudomonas aphyarum]MDD0971122.1 TetR/AcrR family transcriptional regulator [Pseudomonas aphyarum]MDD1125912.1 TetR/AcrR family transcriptional regulator [Pseudomonas aphyarum]